MVRVPSGAVQSFAVDQVLAPQVLGAFLDRVASRPDAASPATRQLLEHARSGELSTLVVPEASPSDGPVPAFLQGLGLLAQNQLDPAANAFRAAMRASPDFYPAIVYLGACYAAGGNDKQAAGAWRTALIKEGDTAPLHVWLADALLRQGRADEALETIERARVQWPGDTNLERRFVAGALLAGRSAEGLQALDRLIAARADDSPSLTFGLLVLYEAFVDRRPIESVETDRARMARLAAAYRARGGPSQALVDTWLDAMKRNRN
jgi:tetratricopeptide (TPR) repeat protein